MRKKTKVGILTLSASDNCGSLLQCYALKKLIEMDEDCSVEIIPFSTPLSHDMYDIIPKRLLMHPRSLFYQIKNYSKLKKSKDDYSKFRREKLMMEDKEIYADQINKLADKYDLLVVGSDQVWNVKMADFDEAFFGEWTKARKVAYAPSLGGNDIQDSKNYSKIIRWLKEYEAVSVCEKKGQVSLESALEKNVPIVLDPTLTIDVKEWEKLVGERRIEEKYIFYYSWAYCEEELKRIVKKESERLGYPVYVVDARKWVRESEKKWNFILSKEDGPIAFLNLMYYAEKVYVESFHGMIFAYLFKKDFWLLDTHKNKKDMNTRLIDISEQLHVENRVLTPFNYENSSYEKLVYQRNIDLENLRKQSIEYIKKNVYGM